MGLGGISIWQLLIILAIVVMLFGTKRLRNLGGDLGAAIKGFRSSITESDADKDATDKADQPDQAEDESVEKKPDGDK
jgi:sec-independent protein translocase protein TatA